MLTQLEFNALLSVIQRAPVSPLEAMGLEAILDKLAPRPPAAPVPAPETPAAGPTDTASEPAT